VSNDNFERTVAGGWGTQSSGWQNYTIVSGSASNIAVGGTLGPGRGHFLVAPGANYAVSTGGVRDEDITFEAFSQTIAGGNGWAYYEVRGQNNNSYRFKVKFNPGAAANMSVQVSRVINNVETNLGTGSVAVANTDPNAGIKIHARITGINPTRLQLKGWGQAVAEPAAYQIDLTDSTAGIQVSGINVIRAYTDASVTSGSNNFGFDNLLMDDITPVTPPPADQVVYAAGDIAGTSNNDNLTANIV
jgi:hypothetical protein